MDSNPSPMCESCDFFWVMNLHSDGERAVKLVGYGGEYTENYLLDPMAASLSQRWTEFQ